MFHVLESRNYPWMKKSNHFASLVNEGTKKPATVQQQQFQSQFVAQGQSQPINQAVPPTHITYSKVNACK